MKFRKGEYSGVWFLWPVIIHYTQLGIEIRYLKWFIGVDWKSTILPDQALKGGEDGDKD